MRVMERAVVQVTGIQGVPTTSAAEDLYMADKRYPERRENRGSVEILLGNDRSHLWAQRRQHCALGARSGR